MWVTSCRVSSAYPVRTFTTFGKRPASPRKSAPVRWPTKGIITFLKMGTMRSAVGGTDTAEDGEHLIGGDEPARIVGCEIRFVFVVS